MSVKPILHHSGSLPMLLEDNARYALQRQGRYLIASFKRPHRVLSTCRVNGGLRDDLTHIANHQACEGVGDVASRRVSQPRDHVEDHRQDCAVSALPHETTALMTTAANMQCAVLARAARSELEVAVAATAGVLGNATRAGDRAGWHEHLQGSQPVAASAQASDSQPPESGAGTVVTLVFINQPCTPACLVRASTVATEAKSAAILDLRMPSLQSAGLATGTGTDQLAIAAPLAQGDEWERHWAGSHNTLGELIGRTTHEAVTRCLLLQNGVCAELRRSLCGALGRYGCDEAALRHCAESEFDAVQANCFAGNLQAIIHDPLSAAAAYALAEIIDLQRTGVLHAEVAEEAILNQTALLASAVAVAPERFAEFRAELMNHHRLPPGALATLAVVRGFARKWN